MLLSFGGVCTIAVSNQIVGEDEVAPGTEIAPDEGAASSAKDTDTAYSPAMQLLGAGLIFCTSWCYAVVSILTRQMQSMHFSVMLFYYSIVASVCSALMILCQAWIKDEPIRLFTYDGEQWLFLCSVSVVNFIGLNCQTIALQNERSGFITLLGYIGLVYAFLGDIFIFNETFQWLELLGVAVVLSLNIALICAKSVQSPSVAARPGCGGDGEDGLEKQPAEGREVVEDALKQSGYRGGRESLLQK